MPENFPGFNRYRWEAAFVWFHFYINDKPAYLIECQGQQHYNAVDFFGGEEQFERQKMHDELKKEYAESLGIPFVEIPFHLTNDQIEDTLRNLGI